MKKKNKKGKRKIPCGSGRGSKYVFVNIAWNGTKKNLEFERRKADNGWTNFYKYIE